MIDKRIQLEQLQAIQNYAKTFSQAKGDYLICSLNIKNDFLNESPNDVASFDGITFVLVTRGSLKVAINTEEFVLSEGSLFVTGPNACHRILEVDKEQGAEFYFLSVSTEFIKSINIDINVLQTSHLNHVKGPVLKVDDEYYSLISNYLQMLYLNAKINSNQNLYTKNISRSLIAALIYQLMQVADSLVKPEKTEVENTQKTGSRRFSYVREFIELVHKHYTTERSVGFYADKLCISPKYLSFIIKDVTNRSAAEWIDEYVILEAKNMLRFSGMNVQQVAYSLNFNNQSSFGKYFKHLTGMSPTQFQKS